MSGSAHGHTIAAWTGVSISFLGFLIAGVAMVVPWPGVVIAGLVLAALGAVVGKLLSVAGYGKKPATKTTVAKEARATTGV
ncbi:HGxxPAAW family protein [Streptacidiphilus monticola]|uniref:HGxxPAAW family protein n=1 Tax=Streptacidiphilus monticola TaxID=2161674 RepID=A0ABW1GAJ0_9ACTN